MRIWLSALAALALTAPLPGHAQNTGSVRPSWKACMDSHLEPGQMDCIDTEIGYQDIRLNRNYKRTMARLTPRQRIVLRTSEREWLRTLEDGCQKSDMRMLTSMTCILFEIAKRADWLETYRPQ